MARSAIYPPSVQPGKPRLGFPPRGWCTVTFSDLFEVIERPAVLDDSKEYQLITAKRSRGGIVPRERLRGKDILTKTQFYVSEGDFLISNRQIIHGGCGIVPPALDGAIVSNEYTVLRLRPILRPDFLSYLPHSIYFQQTCFHASVGVDVEKMVFDVGQWLTFKIHLPPVTEQESIAELLLGVDDAIQATLAVIEQTFKVKRNMLKRLMSKGIGHSRFKRTEIGNVPEVWEVLPLPDLLREPVRNGYSPVCPTEPTERWILSLGALTLDGFSAERVKPAPLDDVRLEGATLEDGDVLISRSNTPERVGLAGLYQGTPAPCYYPDLMMRLRFDLKKMMPEFAVAWLSLLQSEGYFAEAASGTSASMVKINRSTLSGVLVPVPPMVEQEILIQRLRQVESVAALEKQKLTSMERLKSALMSDLLTGRKRVSADALSPAL